MAITKIHPIKSTLKKAIDYIVDPAKTDDKLLVSSFGCAVETADLEFEKTRLLAMQKGNNLAHQLIQAFEPGEVSYAQAHEIGRQLADEILGGKYEYVIATHINKEHYVRFAGEQLSIAASGGAFETGIEVRGRGDMVLGFDLYHMLDALKQFKGEAEVCIHLSSPHAPIVIDAAGRSDFALVVPVRLKEEMAA